MNLKGLKREWMISAEQIKFMVAKELAEENQDGLTPRDFCDVDIYFKVVNTWPVYSIVKIHKEFFGNKWGIDEQRSNRSRKKNY